MGQSMLGLGGTGRLAQPCQNAVLGTIAICQYAVERMAMMIGQRSSQRFVHLARAARQRFAAHAFDNIERGQDDVLLPQHFNQCFSKYDAPVGLLGQIGEVVNKAAIVRNRESRQAQPGLQLRQMLAPCFRSLRVLRPDIRQCATVGQ